MANSKAISLWAYVPPYRPDLDTIPMALVDSIQRLGVNEKPFEPDIVFYVCDTIFSPTILAISIRMKVIRSRFAGS